MKNIIIIGASVFFGVFTMMIVMTVYGDVNRSMELQSSLPSFVEKALEEDMLSGIYTKEDMDLFVTDFAQKVALSWENKSDLIIDVMQYEPKLGVLSLRVTALYERSLGGTGMATCERTVILNKLQE